MFTQPCYIQINTKKLRSELERLGYQLFASYNTDADCIYCFDGYYWPKYLSDCKDSAESVKRDLGINVIFCGDNEEAFLSIAGLCDDRTIYQKYVIDEDGEYYPDYAQTSDAYPVFFEKGDIVDFDDEALTHCEHHKAKINELMEYYGLDEGTSRHKDVIY